ncbi:hypothetical protein [Tenacibaculum amylolyticum]|uniref:hypothetical protein n=1 Tax=Tenacibaculum amylolyticum TaxID=104269 RepID=UPI00389602DA
MKKVLTQIIATVLLMHFVSCTDEKNEIISTEKQAVTQKLPENAISATKLLQKRKGNIKNVYEAQSKQAVYYKIFFVLYPTDWDDSDRLDFLETAKKYHFKGKRILIVSGECDYVDTWYVAYTIPPVDKGKNLIVASDPDLDPDDGSDGGPGEVPSGDGGNYASCHDVPLPPEYYLSSSIDIVTPEDPDENFPTPIR